MVGASLYLQLGGLGRVRTYDQVLQAQPAGRLRGAAAGAD